MNPDIPLNKNGTPDMRFKVNWEYRNAVARAAFDRANAKASLVDTPVDPASASANAKASPVDPASANANAKASPVAPHGITVPTKTIKKRKNVLVIVTGGTISCQLNENNQLAPNNAVVEDWLRKSNECRSPRMPTFVVYAWKYQFDSSDANFAFIQKIMGQLTENKSKFDGFVVVMGTDTIATISSSVRFLSGSLSKPIVFTGSMLPLEEPASDGARNLIQSIAFVASQKAAKSPDVWVLFESKAFRAVRTIKRNCVSAAAFDSPREKALDIFQICKSDALEIANHEGANAEDTTSERTTTEAAEGNTETAATDKDLTDEDGAAEGNTETDGIEIVQIRLTPFTSTAFVNMLSQSQLEKMAFVFTLYGGGNCQGKFKTALKTLVAQSRAVVVLTQCIEGGTLVNYASSAFNDCSDKSSGKRLIDGYDMTVEACTAKLWVALQSLTGFQEICDYMETNQHGELSVDYAN